MRRVFSIVITFIIAGCGVKGGPYPPFSKNPETVRNVKIKQQDRELVVYWNYIPRYEDGRNMNENFKIEIFSIEHRIVKSLHKKGNLYWFRYKFSQIKEYCFRFKVVTKNKESRFSRYFCYIPSIKYPVIKPEFNLNIKKNGINISWPKSSFTVNIYKTQDSVYYPIPFRTISKADSYTDTSVISGNKYCYYITYEDENGVEGSPSQIKCLTFRDIFPPEPPQNPRLIRKEGLYYIIWTESSSKDVIGYIIEINGKKLINKPIKTYVFSIKSIKKGSVIKIYAVDKAGNISKPATLKLNNGQP
ncbi:hypothetical protein GWK41_03145 [Persephonella atlantica]|uniref:Fibronectin type-III domain-containing protein n=1 Tax=Persephonella atlantica TaxID=2699429 RepID=A0ABS1GGK2_9AQUI|nr:lipoprotein [Persephonella atlantica]MBK3332063.1 hypothetical protein [Persephonella atlantica]